MDYCIVVSRCAALGRHLDRDEQSTQPRALRWIGARQFCRIARRRIQHCINELIVKAFGKAYPLCARAVEQRVIAVPAYACVAVVQAPVHAA